MESYIPKSLPLSSLKWDVLVSSIGPSNAALGRYDGILQGIVNPALLLSPLTLQEAVLSSRIEGTITTLEEVLEYEAANQPSLENPAKTDDLREVLNYRKAMINAVESLKERPLCLNLIKEIHSILLDSARGSNKARGQFRTTKNWLGNRPNCPIEEAKFVPPEPQYLMEHLSNLEKYMHYDEQDCLVQAAIVHAQFEIIHPFNDGNGRVGRILIPLFLFSKGLLSSPMLYISAYLEANRDAYYDRLEAISAENDWEGWIIFFLTAIVEQAQNNSEKAKAVIHLYNEMKGEIPDMIHSRFSISAIDAIFANPIFRTSDFVGRSGIPKASAMRILDIFKEKGLLITLQEGKGSRATILMFERLIKLTEDMK